VDNVAKVWWTFSVGGKSRGNTIGTAAIITDKTLIYNYLTAGSLVVDRGYTSHEHFAEIGIIHMNGRLYDPLLRRFLNADENIQDPYNTQNYNKYGYVLNNPLIYSDPSGELFGIDDFLAAVIIGAVVGALTYSAGVLISGDYWNFGNFLKSTIFGAISGAVTFGIGTAFTTSIQAATNILEKGVLYMGQAFAHGFAQGTLSLMQGETFEQAFVAGALGCLGAAAWGKGLALLGADKFADSVVGVIGFGALSGGVGSELSGGNFWQGVVIGGMVAGLNYAMHEMGDGPGPKKKGKTGTGEPRKAKNPDHKKQPAPKDLENWPDAKRSGARNGRNQWKDPQTGEIFEWDGKTGEVERYNPRGKHLGGFDPETGRQISPPDPGRNFKPFYAPTTRISDFSQMGNGMKTVGVAFDAAIIVGSIIWITDGAALFAF